MNDKFNFSLYISELNSRHGFIYDAIKPYSEKDRYYHNLRHIESMIRSANYKGILCDQLAIAIIFHDIVYNPKSNTNEFDSANVYYSKFGGDISIYDAIIETKTHEPTSDLSKKLCDLDLEVLYGNLYEFINYDYGIFKEYQYVDYLEYKQNRIDFLEKMNVSNDKIDYVKNKKINIGLYVGSFNPFHEGHEDVLLRAEEIFDKVIIGVGHNYEKNKSEYYIPEKYKNRQIIEYKGLLTELLYGIGYNVSIIRGIRNDSDLLYEKTLYNTLLDSGCNCGYVTFISNKNNEYISSTIKRQLDNKKND